MVRAMYTLNRVITSFGRFEEVTSYLLSMAALLTSCLTQFSSSSCCFCFRTRALSSKRLSAFKRWSTSHLYVISNSIYSPPAETSSLDSPLAANFNSSLFACFSTFRSLMVMIIRCSKSSVVGDFFVHFWENNIMVLFFKVKPRARSLQLISVKVSYMSSVLGLPSWLLLQTKSLLYLVGGFTCPQFASPIIHDKSHFDLKFFIIEEVIKKALRRLYFLLQLVS